jgi:hypothetical protein
MIKTRKGQSRNPLVIKFTSLSIDSVVSMIKLHVRRQAFKRGGEFFFKDQNDHVAIDEKVVLYLERTITIQRFV